MDAAQRVLSSVKAEDFRTLIRSGLRQAGGLGPRGTLFTPAEEHFRAEDVRAAIDEVDRSERARLLRGLALWGGSSTALTVVDALANDDELDLCIRVLGTIGGPAGLSGLLQVLRSRPDLTEDVLEMVVELASVESPEVLHGGVIHTPRSSSADTRFRLRAREGTEQIDVLLDRLDAIADASPELAQLALEAAQAVLAASEEWLERTPPADVEDASLAGGEIPQSDEAWGGFFAALLRRIGVVGLAAASCVALALLVVPEAWELTLSWVMHLLSGR